MESRIDRSNPTPRTPALHIESHTALRGIAAGLVVWGHYAAVFGRDVGGVDFFIPHTHLGVDLFFMLSGFVLAYVYRDTFATGVSRSNWRQFMARRLARIYPLHLATLLVVLGLAKFVILPGQALVLVLNLGLVQAWGLTDQFLFNAPSWSISCEFAAYLLFPFLMLALRTRRGRMGLLAVALMGYGVLWRIGGGSLDLDAIGRTHALLRVVAAFPLGMLLAWLHLRAQGGWTAWQGVALLGVAAVLVLGLPEIALMPPLALLVLATARDDGPLARLLRLPVLVALGERSYGVYLIQWPLMVLMFALRPKMGAQGVALEVAALAVFLGLLALLSWASYRYFEQPILRAVRRDTRRLAQGSAAE